MRTGGRDALRDCSHLKCKISLSYGMLLKKKIMKKKIWE